MKQCLLTYLSVYLLFAAILPAQASKQEALSPKFIIEQELQLNAVITHLYLLEVDAQNMQAQERIDELRIQLDEAFKGLSDIASDNIHYAQFLISKSQWEKINRDIQSLLHHANYEQLTTHSVITRALKLDKQLHVLRKNLVAEEPEIRKQLRFLDHALLMQKVSREYLHLVTTENHIIANIKQEQLQIMLKNFESGLEGLKTEFSSHRHAAMPTREASMAWHFIIDSINRFPKQSTPTTVVMYGGRIIRELSSLDYMF